MRAMFTLKVNPVLIAFMRNVTLTQNDGNQVQQTGNLDDNAVLKSAFYDLHDLVVRTVNISNVINGLYSRKVLTADDVRKLTILEGQDSVEACRRMLVQLQDSTNPNVYVHLRSELNKDPANAWIVSRIDERSRLLNSSNSSNSKGNNQSLTVTSIIIVGELEM